MNFSQALDLLKEGKKVQRKGWNNPNILVEAQFPDELSKNTKTYLAMIKLYPGAGDETTTFDRFPLDLSCESIFAEDWEVME